MPSKYSVLDSGFPPESMHLLCSSTAVVCEAVFITVKNLLVIFRCIDGISGYLPLYSVPGKPSIMKYVYSGCQCSLARSGHVSIFFKTFSALSADFT